MCFSPGLSLHPSLHSRQSSYGNAGGGSLLVAVKDQVQLGRGLCGKAGLTGGLSGNNRDLATQNL